MLIGINVIDNIIYTALICIFVYIFLELEDDLRKDYFHKDLPDNTLGTGYYFFIALIFPWGYFRKEKLLEGWFVYLFSLVAFFSALFLFMKLIGA